MGKRMHGVELPSTVARSAPKAQHTYAKTLASAEKAYGPGERASRTAMSSLKHGFQKVGDHWEAKARKGPSDAQAAKAGVQARKGRSPTHGGVDVLGQTRQALYERARDLGVAGRSTMNKAELADAIARKQG